MIGKTKRIQVKGIEFRTILLLCFLTVGASAQAQFPFERQTDNYDVVVSLDEYSSGYFVSTTSQDYVDSVYSNRKSILYKMGKNGIVKDSIVLDSMLLADVFVYEDTLIAVGNKIGWTHPLLPSLDGKKTRLLKLDSNLSIVDVYEEPSFLWSTAGFVSSANRILISERYLDTSMNFYEVVSVFDNSLNLISCDSLDITFSNHNIFEQRGKLFFGGHSQMQDPNDVWQRLELAVLDSATVALDTIYASFQAPCFMSSKLFQPISDTSFVAIEDSLSQPPISSGCAIRVREYQYIDDELEVLNSFVVDDMGHSNAIAPGGCFGVNSAGDYIIGGSSYDFDVGQWATNTDGGYSIWCVQPDGTPKWRTDMLHGQYRLLTSVLVDSDDNILLAGMFNRYSGALDFGNFHVTKLNADGTTLSTNDLEFGEKVKVYPNPSNDGIFTIEKELKKVQVVDLNGKLVFQQNSVVERIDLSEFQQGIYYLRAMDLTGNGVELKLVKLSRD